MKTAPAEMSHPNLMSLSLSLSANIFLRMRKFLRPHTAYSNRFQPFTRIDSIQKFSDLL